MTDLVGKELIDFELPYVGEKGLEKAKLSEEAKKGSVLLLFFPAAWTRTCTKEVCFMRDSLADYSNLNTKVYGISVDLPWALDKFKQDENLNFDLLSDANKSVIRDYDVVWPDLGGIHDTARRSAFVIKDGKVSYQWVCENQGQMPPFEEIKKILE